MSVVFTCLLTWAYIEWCYIGQLSQFDKRYRSLFTSVQTLGSRLDSWVDRKEHLDCASEALSQTCQIGVFMIFPLDINTLSIRCCRRTTFFTFCPAWDASGEENKP